jgi:hypothetical protein
MDCHFCCPNHHVLTKAIRNKDFFYICDICKSELKGDQILYSCTVSPLAVSGASHVSCDFDVCANCSVKPYSIGFRGLLAKKPKLLDAFEKDPTTITNLYRDLISAEIYHTAQKW